MADAEQPKIIIDTDWKSQAQAEKERLASAAKPAAPASAGPAAGHDSIPGAPGQRAPGEGVRFEDLVGLLTTQALSFMGAYPDPRTGQAVVSLELAKLHIDLLGVLEQKTKGNLAEAEQKMLTQTVHELRLEFVDLTKAISAAIQQGKISPAQAGAMGAGSLAGPGIAVPPPPAGPAAG
ncbi:MAG: DUF1844 domain-containing protein [Phycisphaerales bacterium]|nr:DUF1844 domain-containing protein [Phycisphaerales bacterium]